MSDRMAFLIANGVVTNHTCDDKLSKVQKNQLMPTYNRPKTPQEEGFCCWSAYLDDRQVLYSLIWD